MIDSNPRRLSLLYKYEVDTLAELGSLDEYDYLIDTSGDPEVRQRILKTFRPMVKILLLDPPCTSPGQVDTAESTPLGEVISTRMGTQPQDWTQAIRLVQKGIVRLDDHAITVEPLQAYPDAWENLQSQESFNVLLRVSDELEAL